MWHHTTVIHSGHNALLAELYRGITEAVAAGVVAISAPPLIGRVEITHHNVLAAISARDPDRAAAEAGCVIDRLLAPRKGGDTAVCGLTPSRDVGRSPR